MNDGNDSKNIFDVIQGRMDVVGSMAALLDKPKLLEQLTLNSPKLKWMSRVRIFNKKVDKFLRDLDEVVILIHSHQADLNYADFLGKKLSDADRLKLLYDRVKNHNYVERFYALYKSAEALNNDPKLRERPGVSGSNGIASLAMAVPIQVFSKSFVLYPDLIEAAEKKGDTKTAETLKELQKSCADISEEYQNMLAAMEPVPSNPAKLAENTEVFKLLRQFVEKKMSDKDKPAFLEKIDFLLNRYRQKLTLYIRMDESKIESSDVEAMLSNINILLYFAKKADPNYVCSSMEGLVSAAKELSERANKKEGKGELPLLGNKANNFLAKIQVLFPQAQEKKSELERYAEELQQKVVKADEAFKFAQAENSKIHVKPAAPAQEKKPEAKKRPNILQRLFKRGEREEVRAKQPRAMR
ncbi:MAG TPA: hypothetical protein VGV92_09700 [Gammaproteobacteria bacterium]|nr:hypothetical protein [Gammaproteobacteria bacterium]